MNETKKTINKILLPLICGIVVIFLVVYFLIALNKHKEKSSIDSNDTTLSSSTITKGGTYKITGNNECIVINTNDSVELDLENSNITCESGPAINVESVEKLNIVLTGENNITSTTTEELDGAIFSKDDIIFLGTGSLNITSNYDGIVSKDSLVFNSGTFIINASDDGIRGKDSIEITDGTFNITAQGDGIKTTNEEDTSKGYINITNGTFSITSGNDGIQAVTNLSIKDSITTIKTTGSVNSESDSSKGLKAGTLVTIDGGTYNINTTDDAVHSNGNIIINNGEFTINTKDDGFHADDTLTINDGTINIENCYEGFEGSKVYIKGGNNSINASDDGINAASSDSSQTSNNGMNGRDKFKNSTGTLLISGGTTKVLSAGDGLDSNGTITISGGTTYVESSNNGPEEAIDHVGSMNITAGTLVTVSKNLANDDGTKTSDVHFVNTSVNNGTGTISIGDIKYTPTTSGYKYIFIASSKLSTGSNTLTYGSDSTSVTLETGTVSNIGGNQMRGQTPNGMGPQGPGMR